MGKGAGLCFSAPRQADAQQVEVKPAPTRTQPAPAKPEPPTVPVAVSAPKLENSKMTANKKIAVVFYSTYGHIYQLAQKVKAGVDSVPGFEGVLLQVPEILPEEVLKAMHAPPKPDVPVAKAADLPQYDGIIFGAPTRFGMVAAQMKAFIDSTGGLWQSGALVGKPASVFVSTGTQGGGIETTALTFYTQLAHHGMVIVPTGYSFGERLFGMDEVRAGTAYGASTYAGPTGARQPSELELDYAQHQGSYFARIAGKLTA